MADTPTFRHHAAAQDGSPEADARALPKSPSRNGTRPHPAERARPDKHDAIARAAAEMFLAEGFERASLDQIAHRAGVSKQTIYSHFADKEALFKAICTELTEKLTIPLRQPPGATDLRSALTRLGEDALAMMLKPASLDLHRLVTSAAHRFPELGRVAYEAGAKRMIRDVAALISERSRIGDGFSSPIPVGRAEILAEQFVGMLRGFHQLRGLLSVRPASAARRKAYVGACVDLLLRGA
jgi:TetR/AcrR family transcriptional repressor of mexJK operon